MTSCPADSNASHQMPSLVPALSMQQVRENPMKPRVHERDIHALLTTQSFPRFYTYRVPVTLCQPCSAGHIWEGSSREHRFANQFFSSPDVTGEIFIEYLRTVESNHSLSGSKNKPAILFCDNCACHCSDEVKRELSERGILLITYPPYRSHIFQFLDTLLFGRLKAANGSFARSEPGTRCPSYDEDFPCLKIGDNESDHSKLMGKSKFWFWAVRWGIISLR
jgi:hypothetical protein